MYLPKTLEQIRPLEKVNYFGGGKSRWEEEKRKG
jgi:hypothetical protein